MKSSASLTLPRTSLSGILIDLGALAFIYFAPTLAHLVNIPLYAIEPMRLMVILAIVHSGRTNAIILALTLPLFSFVVSGHPAFLKTLIISVELLVNVLLFFYLSGKVRQMFTAMFLAILGSKILCYLMYLIFFPLAFVIAEADPFFLGIQLLSATAFSGYVFFLYKKQE